MKKTKKYRVNWILQTAMVLLCMVMISVWMLSGLYARYATTDSGGDHARVAAFCVTDSSTMSQSFTEVMKPEGESKKIEVSLQNKSETAVNYQIAFELEGNLPLLVKSASTNSNLKQDGNSLVWNTVVSANKGSEDKYTFQLDWIENKKSYQYSEGIESVTVVIVAVQED